jgi:hypothetical protein
LREKEKEWKKHYALFHYPVLRMKLVMELNAFMYVHKEGIKTVLRLTYYKVVYTACST